MNSEQGSVTLLGILIMMVLGSLGATLLLLSKTNMEIAANHRDGIAAQYLAEAAVQWMVVKFKTDQDFVRKTEKTQQQFTIQPLSTCPTTKTLQVISEPRDSAYSTNKRLITAYGFSSKAARQVIAQITLTPLLDNQQAVSIVWNNP